MIDPKDEDGKTSKQLYELLYKEYSDDDEALEYIKSYEQDYFKYPEDQRILYARQLISSMMTYY
jgi:hypothetical protein